MKSPCDDCEYAKICLHGKACKQYESFLETGKWDKSTPKKTSIRLYNPT